VTRDKKSADKPAAAKMSGSPSIAEQMRATITSIERENGDLNAFVLLTPERAMAAAEAADKAKANGLGHGPLFGKAYAVKDIIDVEGLPTRCGSLTRKQIAPSETSAHVVKKMDAAGAIAPGKTHTVEYAFGGYGTNVTVGTPKNPWDRATHRVPGGSSSGTGVAVGAGLVPMGLGTDTGGSVRIPAAMCGCVGLKTSVGLIGRSGVVPLSQTLDSVGPLAEDVTTAAHMFMAMQGPDALDPTTDGVKQVDALADLERGVAGLRIGRVSDNDMPLMRPEVAAAFAKSVRFLEKAGARIEPFSMPESFDSMTRGTGIIISAECYANHREHVDVAKSDLAPPILARMIGGRGVSAGDYINVLREREASIARFLRAMDRLDAIILPTTPVVAMPVAEVDETVTPLAAHTRFANYLALCGLAVPVDVTSSGLPTSLQIVVRRFDDALALRIGRAFEKERGAFARPG